MTAIDIDNQLQARLPAGVALTPQQRAVFEVLAQQQGRVVGRTELSRRAGLGDLSRRRCDSLLVEIRRQIGADRIVTVRGRGWMLID